MQHHWTMFGAILGDIGRIKSLRQNKIDLKGAALPVAADRFAQNELELGTIKRALPRIVRIL